MPIEIFDTETFLKLALNAQECRVKRHKDVVKLKLKTSHKLYTMKLGDEKAEELLKELKCPILDL
jgi:hypothetical protein